jgi:hypothetical protein
LKKVLSTPPVLVAPKEKEPLLLYIAATHQVVSTILVVERSEEGKAHGVQRPVYFISEVLSPTKQKYPHYQKLAYSVFTTARKHYKENPHTPIHTRQRCKYSLQKKSQIRTHALPDTSVVYYSVIATTVQNK